MAKKNHAFITIFPASWTYPSYYPVSKPRIDWKVDDGRTGSDPLTASALGALVWMFLESGVNSIEFRNEEE